MRGLFHLAWRYLAHHRIKTGILLLSITLIVYVPVGLRVLVAQSAEELTARAAATPLLVGAKGSPLELVLSSLYFESTPPEALPYAQVERIDASGFALAIPLHARFHSRGRPIVGTTLDYFEHRGLAIAAGRQMAVLGECVLGARVAREAGLGPGDEVVSSPESVFDLAGVYPLRMPVAGVLAPAHSPDDDAIFVDIKTAWVIGGIGHGHQDLSRPEAAGAVLERDGERITANASVLQFNQITAANLESFHFHGDRSAFPVTAVVAVPHDERSSALLRGRYQAADETSQIVRPAVVMEELLGTIFTVQGYVVAAVLFVGGSTAATTVLVFLLSLRLRRREIETMFDIGASRGGIAALLAIEILSVVLASIVLAAGLTALTARYGSELIRGLLLG